MVVVPAAGLVEQNAGNFAPFRHVYNGAAMSLAPGTKLGPYEIQSPVGAGGMGEVYRARDTRLERTVAIKVLPEQFSSSPELRQRFEREARALSSFSHPHICHLYDVGSQHGIDYLVMEYLEGETLASRLQRGPLPLDQLLKVAVEVAEALERAHRQGVVHRDLKPGNVMLTKSGAKLMDFGLVKSSASDLGVMAGTAGVPLTPSSPTRSIAALTAPASPLTQKGTILGTFQYMAPEVLQGAEADARSDIFSFGCLVYEMATARPAFEGRSQLSVLAAILEKDPEPISNLMPITPPALEHVVKGCLAKDPDERFQTAHDVKMQLKWMSEAGASAIRPALPVPARRKHLEWVAWGVAALLAVAGLAAGWWLHQPPAPAVLRANVELPDGLDVPTQDTTLEFSHDGRKLALMLASAGKNDIWVRSLDSLTMQPLAGTTGGAYPTWSPDGRFLAFFADHKLKKIDVSGGTVQTICDADDGRGLAWGPDGTIVFAPGPYTGLYQVSSSGGTPKELTHLGANGETHRLPQFLPDGEHALFLTGTLGGKSNAIQAVSLKTGQVSDVLRPAESRPLYVAPGYLIFMRGQNLMAQPFDARRLQLTGEAVPIAEHVQFNPTRWTGSYAVSDTGLLIYRRQESGDKLQLTWLDPDGKQLGKVGEPMNLVQLALSPDSKRALFLRPEEGAQGQFKLWMFDFEHKVMGRFTFGPGIEQSPTWSPDGKQIVYSANRGDGFAIYIKAADGSKPEQLLYRGEDSSVPDSWSPDGKLLAFHQVGGQNKNGSLWMLPMEGDHKAYRMHPTAEAVERQASFSPDGHWFCYQSNESGIDELYVVPFPGPGGKWQITQGGGSGSWIGANHLAWATPGLQVLTATVTAKGSSFGLGPPQPLFGGKTIPQLLGVSQVNRIVFDSTRDGKRFLMGFPVTEHTGGASLTLASDWTTALKK
jgi:Tol biopolymer transport system component